MNEIRRVLSQRWNRPLSCFALLLCPALAFAQGPIGVVSSALGKAYILRSGDKLAVQRGMEVFGSDQLVTLPRAAVKLTFADGSSIVAVEPGSIEIEEYSTRAAGSKVTLKSVLNLVSGKVRVFVKPRPGGHEATVKTGNAVMGVRGTTFIVGADGKDKTSLVVLEGKVALSSAREPEQSVVVQENQYSVVAAAAKPVPPATVPEAVRAEIREVAQTMAQLPDAPPDGEAPADLTLPAPVVPAPAQVVQSSGKATGGETAVVPRVVQVPEAMVVPLGAVMASRAGVRCDLASLQQLRRAAHDFDAEAFVIGRELVRCPQLASEAQFWLTFHFRAQGSEGRLADLPEWTKGDEVVLDLKTEREEVFLAALRGDSARLARLVREKKPGYAGDREALLTLARAFVFERKYEQARAAYRMAQGVSTLGAERDLQIELGYLDLLSGKYDDALDRFHPLMQDSLTASQRAAVARGILLAERQTLRNDGGADDSLQLAFGTREGKDVSQRRLGVGWNSEKLNLFVLHHDYGRWKGESAGLKADPGERQASEVLVEKSFALTSGTLLSAKAGFHWARLFRPEAEAELRYRFRWGGWVGGALAYQPFGGSYFVFEDAQADWMIQRAGVVAGMGEWLTVRAESLTIAQEDMAVRASALATLPLHRTREASATLGGGVSYEDHPNARLNYFSPAQRMEAVGYAEASFRPWSWLGVRGRYGYHMAFQDSVERRETVPAETYLADLQRRLAAERESGFDVHLGIEVRPFLRWLFSLDVKSFQASDELGEGLVRDSEILLTAKYLYQRERTRPDRVD